jgi:hypothetical protein
MSSCYDQWVVLGSARGYGLKLYDDPQRRLGPGSPTDDRVRACHAGDLTRKLAEVVVAMPGSPRGR